MTYLREHPEQTVLVHLTRAPCAPTELPSAAFGPGRRSFTTIHGVAPRLDGDHLVLSGDGPTASAIVMG
jgi:alpha-glucosidase